MGDALVEEVALELDDRVGDLDDRALPLGIYELKYFFNSSISRVGGEDIASEAVKNQIKQIIAKEPAEKPFSDQKIVEILRSQNVDIARRTVAKYREVLGILPSSKRKRYF